MRRGFGILIITLCALAVSALAQVVITSTIVGTVTDPQGAVIPNANVTLRNVDTGVQWTAATDGSGAYQFPNLIAGHYEVEVVKVGFAKATSTAMALQNGTTQRINFAMTIGSTEEVVQVSSAAPLIDTENADVSGVIDNKFAENLPIAGRNYLNYAQVLPDFNSGTGDNSRMHWGLASSTMPGAMQLNVGGTEYGVGYYVDGLDNNDNWVEGPLMNVNQDTIQEVKAVVSSYSAEYGRDVGQIDVTTKSGTNRLHGSVYNAFQNAGLNTVDPYSKYQGIPRSAYHQNQYGFTVGGPVFIPKVFNGKNRLFFFGSFERLRNRGQSQFTTYIPTDAERTGDFSAWLQRFSVDPTQCDGSSNAPANCRFVIYDPTTYNPTTQLRQPYPNNVITNPAPAALAYLSHFPEPNGYTSPAQGDYDNYAGTTIAGLDNNNYTIRADYNLSSRDSLYFRWFRENGTVLGSGGLIPALAMGDGPMHRMNTYQVHYVHAFSPTFNNEFNISWMRGYNFSNSPSQASSFANTSWIQDLFQNSSTGMAGFTPYDKSLFGIANDATFSVNLGWDSSYFAHGLSTGSTEYWYQYVPIFQLTDNVEKILGRHSLKFGYYMARRSERDNDIVRSTTFAGNYTSKGPNIGDGSGFNTLAEFETGFVTDMGQRTPVASGDASLYFGMPEYALFVNDSWQATQKLTLNIGLRYDLPIPAYSINSYWGVLDQTYPGWRMIMPGLTPETNSHPFSADKKDLAPRIGLAYRLDNRTVVRSGYGVFYETGRFKFMDQMFWNSPGYGGADYNSTYMVADPAETYYTINDVWPAATAVQRGEWPLPLGTDGGTLCDRCDTATTDAKSWQTPYLQRWSLDIQREIGKSVVATVGYVGSKGTHLPIQYDLNLPAQGTYLNSNSFYEARPLTSVAPDRWGAINTVRGIRNNNYNAMNAALRIRNWHNLTSQLSYAWSKQMDTLFGENGESGTHALGGQWHPEWSYGPSDANHTNRFVAAFTYELPGQAIGNRLAREVLGWWQISSISTFESGAPTTVWNGYTSSYDYMGDVPDLTCGGNLSRGKRNFTHYFNTSCYSEPVASTDQNLIAQGVTNFAIHRGNERRNSLTGPGINNWDLGLQKSLPVIRESQQLVIRLDAFNAFNHAQWSSINTWDDREVNPESQFGWVTGARPGRRLQLNMHFVF
ncbi:MAG TPA: carboxypeptidase regulatory-like domain-containing protein [Terracidiphilus sp.]|nr:carboxypeptidase regulatory-like domain-containing protein [Terracidiphilus sp.]